MCASNGMPDVTNHLSITSRCHSNSTLLGNVICRSLVKGNLARYRANRYCQIRQSWPATAGRTELWSESGGALQ